MLLWSLCLYYHPCCNLKREQLFFGILIWLSHNFESFYLFTNKNYWWHQILWYKSTKPQLCFPCSTISVLWICNSIYKFQFSTCCAYVTDYHPVIYRIISICFLTVHLTLNFVGKLFSGIVIVIFFSVITFPVLSTKVLKKKSTLKNSRI